MALVGVQLRARRVAGDPQPVGDAQAAVARVRVRARGVDAVVLEAEVVEGEVAADGEQDACPSTVEPSSRSTTCAPSVAGAARARAIARTPVRTVTPSRSRAQRTRRRSVGGPWEQPRSGLDDRHRDAEPRKHLGQLAARRPPPRTSRLVGSSRVSVASRFVHGLASARPSIGGTLDVEPTATKTSSASRSCVSRRAVTSTTPAPRCGRRRGNVGAGRLERLDVRRCRRARRHRRARLTM